MRPYKLLIVLLPYLFVSCKKDKITGNCPGEHVKVIELLNGSYTGTIYKWTRDFDSTHQTVVETFDTIYNATSFLALNEDSNSIKFGGILYQYHDDLILSCDKDTINGVKQYTTNPYHSIAIIKSEQFVRLYTSAYSSSGGPWAYTQIEEYYKD